MNDKTWVDFKAIKSAVSMEMMLARYNVNGLGRKNDELRGRCPIHQGEGKDTFHVNVSKNVFNCFSCKKRGNILDFVAAMEKCSVRDAAVKIGEWFSVDGTDKKEGSAVFEKVAATPVEDGPDALINKPLSFQLKGIDHGHPYLKERGLTAETIEMFGVGFFSGKGSMSGRVVIPIHNQHGELLAYAGRAIDGAEPRYKLPAGFHKSLELYSLHRAIQGGRDMVVVVEGFFDCMKVASAGFPAVALVGSSISVHQELLLAKNFERAWIMMDGDKAGVDASREILPRLAQRMFARLAELPDGKQPDGMTEDELRNLLSGK